MAFFDKVKDFSLQASQKLATEYSNFKEEEARKKVEAEAEKARLLAEAEAAEARRLAQLKIDQENGDAPIYTIGGMDVYIDRLVISRNKNSSAFVGSDKTILFIDITSVQNKAASILNKAHFEFSFAGASENAGVKGLFFKESNNENLVFYDEKKEKELAAEICDYINKRIRELKMSQYKPVQQIVEKTSAADEILKFKQLLDVGIITQQEFDEKKKQLLNL